MQHNSSALNPDSGSEMATTTRALRHSLRTPLNHIIGFAEMLRDEVEDLEEPGPFVAFDDLIATGRIALTVIEELANNPSPEGLADLPSLLAPSLAAIRQTCATLARYAATVGPAHFLPDIEKIAVAATRLGELAAAADLEANLIAENEEYAAQASPLTTQQPGAAILIVDDNELNRDLLDRQIRRLGHTTSHAANGREALEHVSSQPFALILLDLMMPVMDGFAVLAALKADPGLQHIAVIVLSAHADHASIIRAIELGADDYLPKPFDPILLRARIGACLHKQHLRELELGYVRRIEAERRRADDLLHVVIPLGVALSVEKDFNQLLERIVLQAQDLCRADGSTLYLRDGDRLRFVIAHNRSLNIAMGGATGKDIPFAPLRLYDEQTGAPLFNYVVTHTALEGKTITIADAYAAEGYDFSGTRDFDARTGYRTTSVLNIPLKDGLGHVIGVLQLINALDEQGSVVAFDPIAAQMLESLGTLAAAALSAYAREQQLRQEIADLRIEIDQVKQQREVAAITNSPYFAELQEKARLLRAGVEANGAATSRTPVRTEIEIAGQRLVVRMCGPARGRLLLLIHGWSSSWYALSPLIPTLSERYRCVAVDLPGFGESPRLRQRASIPAYADLMAELIAQISPGIPAMVVGHSMGGMIALTLALRHPEGIERIALLCPTISGRLSAWINAFILPITMLERISVAGRMLSYLEPSMLRVTDGLMKPASFAERSDIAEADYLRLRADARRPGQGRVRSECFWAMRENDLSECLGKISIPALVIWGMEDNTVPLRDASLVADKWPAAQLRILPKAGHWPQFETPDATRRHVRSFLSTPVKLLKNLF